LWKIDSADNTIDKKLKKLKGNKDVIKNYKTAVVELASSKDPTKLGEKKHGRFKYCYAYSVTKSYRLVYRVLVDKNIIQLIDLDDHKNLFGRDNRS